MSDLFVTWAQYAEFMQNFRHGVLDNRPLEPLQPPTDSPQTNQEGEA